MCATCGCNAKAEATLLNLQTGRRSSIAKPQAHSHDHHAHDHPHDHAHSHDHAHPHGHSHVVDLETRILAKNDAVAARNRVWLAERGVLALNLMSAPGAGKTTLLECTIRAMKNELPLCVLEGDQATANDATRIIASGAPAVQVNTGAGCHLEADMIAQGLAELNPPRGSIAIIENVGNLVCPALFDLGETKRVAILSVTEGDDKPLKYPHMFRSADLLILNKIDLLPYVDFDLARAGDNARSVNPELAILSLSARSGAGLAEWYAWLRSERAAARHSPRHHLPR